MLPGTIGAPENVSYGVSGAAGDEPFAKFAASGKPSVPKPFVLCETNVMCAAAETLIVPGRGVGVGDADGTGDGVGGGGKICAEAGSATHAAATAAHAAIVQRDARIGRQSFCKTASPSITSLPF
jgi:hypothetical protein